MYKILSQRFGEISNPLSFHFVVFLSWGDQSSLPLIDGATVQISSNIEDVV